MFERVLVELTFSNKFELIEKLEIVVSAVLCECDHIKIDFKKHPKEFST